MLSLVSPTLLPVSSFDVKKEGYLFKYDYRNPNVSFVDGCELIILNANQNTIIYQGENSDFRFQYFLEPQITVSNNLTNNSDYDVKIRVHRTINGVKYYSPYSSVIRVRTRSLGVFEFANISESQLIKSQKLYLKIRYNQVENVKLVSYAFNLYDDKQKVIYESGDIFYQSNPSLEHTINGLSNGKIYYIEARGIDEFNKIYSTGLIRVHVNYQDSNIHSKLKLESVNSVIKIQSNLIPAIGEVYNGNYKIDNPPFIENGTMLNLATNNYSLKYNQGYSFDNSFTICIEGNKFFQGLTEESTEILSFESSDAVCSLYINVRKNDPNGSMAGAKVYLSLFVENGILSNYYESERKDIFQMLDMTKIIIRKHDETHINQGTYYLTIKHKNKNTGVWE